MGPGAAEVCITAAHQCLIGNQFWAICEDAGGGLSGVIAEHGWSVNSSMGSNWSFVIKKERGSVDGYRIGCCRHDMGGIIEKVMIIAVFLRTLPSIMQIDNLNNTFDVLHRVIYHLFFFQYTQYLLSTTQTN